MKSWSYAVYKRVCSPLLRDILRQRGLLDDLYQEIGIIEWLSSDLQTIEQMRALNRALYWFLKSNGFRRSGKGYEDPVFPFTIALHANSIRQETREELMLHLRGG